MQPVRGREHLGRRPGRRLRRPERVPRPADRRCRRSTTCSRSCSPTTPPSSRPSTSASEATDDRAAEIAALEKQLGAEKADDRRQARRGQGRCSTSSRPRSAQRAARLAQRRRPAARPTSPASGPRRRRRPATRMAQVGDAYVYGAAGPNAFDCSGLTMMAWAQAGVGLPHSSSAQFGSGPHISASDLQPGDLVFYYSPISHVGMYIGNGLIVHAANPGAGVAVAGLFSMPYSARSALADPPDVARRPVVHAGGWPAFRCPAWRWRSSSGSRGAAAGPTRRRRPLAPDAVRAASTRPAAGSQASDATRRRGRPPLAGPRATAAAARLAGRGRQRPAARSPTSTCATSTRHGRTVDGSAPWAAAGRRRPGASAGFDAGPARAEVTVRASPVRRRRRRDRRLRRQAPAARRSGSPARCGVRRTRRPLVAGRGWRRRPRPTGTPPGPAAAGAAVRRVLPGWRPPARGRGAADRGRRWTGHWAPNRGSTPASPRSPPPADGSGAAGAPVHVLRQPRGVRPAAARQARRWCSATRPPTSPPEPRRATCRSGCSRGSPTTSPCATSPAAERRRRGPGRGASTPRRTCRRTCPARPPSRRPRRSARVRVRVGVAGLPAAGPARRGAGPAGPLPRRGRRERRCAPSCGTGSALSPRGFVRLWADERAGVGLSDSAP